MEAGSYDIDDSVLQCLKEEFQNYSLTKPILELKSALYFSDNFLYEKYEQLRLLQNMLLELQSKNRKFEYLSQLDFKSYISIHEIFSEPENRAGGSTLNTRRNRLAIRDRIEKLVSVIKGWQTNVTPFDRSAWLISNKDSFLKVEDINIEKELDIRILYDVTLKMGQTIFDSAEKNIETKKPVLYLNQIDLSIREKYVIAIALLQNPILLPASFRKIKQPEQLISSKLMVSNKLVKSLFVLAINLRDKHLYINNNYYG